MLAKGISNRLVAGAYSLQEMIANEQNIAANEIKSPYQAKAPADSSSAAVAAQNGFERLAFGVVINSNNQRAIEKTLRFNPISWL
ncbi:hypothetical protein NIASO_18505 [Niabella soli DSM 19437]|uniref:Uncharacterized protein n=1 Tax=Niabella soli DSM 19437 TaxID=929713 RepID=W0F4R5_9BACT|nr:hypothetical protein NIASO_18505 [Niabella soli DSM 19437]